jgi:hypothetical protein
MRSAAQEQEFKSYVLKSSSMAATHSSQVEEKDIWQAVGCACKIKSTNRKSATVLQEKRMQG